MTGPGVWPQATLARRLASRASPYKREDHARRRTYQAILKSSMSIQTVIARLRARRRPPGLSAEPAPLRLALKMALWIARRSRRKRQESALLGQRLDVAARGLSGTGQKVRAIRIGPRSPPPLSAESQRADDHEWAVIMQASRPRGRTMVANSGAQAVILAPILGAGFRLAKGVKNWQNCKNHAI